MENLKIPKKIRVGGIDYDIVLIDKFEDDCDHWGVCKNSLSEIVMVKTSDSLEMKECVLYSTLFHELCHAIDNVYCGNCMSEECIDKIATFWFQLLSDNYFYIERDDFPDKIRIQGLSYDVILDHEFDLINKTADIGLKMCNLTIKCSGDKSFSKEVLKRDLFTCLTQHIVGSDLFSDEERDEFNIESFCSGLYQVLKDTKLNDLIREVC